MVLTEKIEKGEVIFTGNKKYKRIIVKNGIEWRRFKTNHQVTREQHEILEEEYRGKFSNSDFPNLKSSVIKRFNLENDSHRVILENGLAESSENGKYILAGVKRVKEITGWGLRESKDYADLFFERKTKYNKATNSTVKEEAKRRLDIFMKRNDSKLACVKYLVGITGWGLRDSKDFFEDYMKFKEAQKLVRRGF